MCLSNHFVRGVETGIADQVLNKDTIHPFIEMCVIFFEKNKTRRKYFKERLVVSSLTINAFF